MTITQCPSIQTLAVIGAVTWWVLSAAMIALGLFQDTSSFDDEKLANAIYFVLKVFAFLGMTFIGPVLLLWWSGVVSG